MNTRWINHLLSRFGPRKEGETPFPGPTALMSRAEKIELEALLEVSFLSFFAEHGGRAFMDPGWAVSLSAAHGPKITRDPPDVDQLARVEFQGMLSIRSLQTTDLPHIAVARSMLPNLATEATHELALQVNRTAARLSAAAAAMAAPKSEQIRRED